jgi:SAM-dependent methyltransferase
MRGVATTPSRSSTDIRSFFDRCASTGSPEQHGHAQRLLEYRLALVRNLAQPRPTDVVLDLGCGKEHHLLALGPEVARGIAIDISPGMTRDEFVLLLDQAGFRGIRFAPWRFIPKGDVPAAVASLLALLDVIGRYARLDSHRGGLSLCAWKQAKSTQSMIPKSGYRFSEKIMLHEQDRAG